MKTMTVQAKMFAVFWCLLALEHGAVGSLTLEATPTNISLGLTDLLTVNCTFTYDSLPNVATILSLIISKNDTYNNQSQDFQELATLTSFAPDHVNPMFPLNASIDGHIGTQEDSFLHMHWTFPTEDEKGIYRCDANVLDNFGHPKDIFTTIEVTSHQPGLRELIEKLHGLQTQLNSQKDRQSELENLMKNQTQLNQQNVTIVEQQTQLNQQNDMIVEQQTQLNQQNVTIVAQQTQLNQQNDMIVEQQTQLIQQNVTIVELQTRLNQQNVTIVTQQTQLAQLNNTITELQSLLSEVPGFEKSSEYNGRYYLLSKLDLSEASVAETVCESHGGYLVEIDDMKEDQFVMSFVDQFTNVSYVILGATDEAQEGQWRFRYSGQVMSYDNWYSGEPDVPDNDCISIQRMYQWKMRDWPCTYRSLHEKFLCEIPIM